MICVRIKLKIMTKMDYQNVSLKSVDLHGVMCYSAEDSYFINYPLTKWEKRYMRFGDNSILHATFEVPNILFITYSE